MKKTKMLEKIRTNAKTALGLFALSLLVFVCAFVAYGYEFRQKTLPKQHLANESFAGLSKDGLTRKIEKLEIDNKQSKIVLKSDDKSWDMTMESAGWKVKRDEMVNEIYGYGHNSSWYRRIWPLCVALTSGREYDLLYEIDQKKLEDWVSSINNEIGTPKTEANLQVKGDNVKVIEPQSGKKINLTKLSEEVTDVFKLKTKAQINLELSDDAPIISRQDAESLEDEAKELSSDKVELSAPNGIIDLGPAKIGASIELKKQIKEKRGLFGSHTEYGPAYVSFSEDKIREILDREADSVNIAPVDARFTINDGKVSILQNSSNGRAIKTDEAIKLIIAKLEEGKDKKIDLPSEMRKPAIDVSDVSDIEKYGIKELIGTATTDFSGSPNNRIQNIKIGVQSLSGTLVKPDDEFSTIGHLGAIDGSSGYLQELVIKENATVPEFGGGLCQVSTTLFRAIMNAGLDVTERHNHSYRVSYYEPPIGMDATIYSPSPDLKFKNDYSGYVLVQGKVEGNKVTFDIYGTKDGREVEITEPYVYDVTAPPADIYIDDPSLEPGEVKRTDRAHPGAKAVFYYRVKKAGKTNEQKFLSSYVPWAAKYLRGPAVSEGQ